MCFSACKQYFEKYPGDHELLWEVEGVGHWYQRIPVTRALQREALKIPGKSVFSLSSVYVFIFGNLSLLACKSSLKSSG